MKVKELIESLTTINPELEVGVVEGRLYFYSYDYSAGVLQENVVDYLNAQIRMINPDFSAVQ